MRVGAIGGKSNRRTAPSDILIRKHLLNCLSSEKALGRQGQLSRCLEISLEISTMEVFPVNSNFTFPSDEK
ncbi:hypothetical protein [Pseudomonas sp. 24 E 1]|nr:hypothetical protein [Pseudomonas sp. 24 E 1]CRM21657.1 hypothetical protein [Pseudomonas sp. 24 R 17]CRM24114.1 hypothetical protein [Pseudomonas sp. 24 E 1]CRM50906.1 hypothetical protein [Pseudomonas sp. 52 E 6]